MNERPVLVLGESELSMHHGAVGIARSLGRIGVPVHHAHGSVRQRASYSRYSSGELLLPRAPEKLEEKLALLSAFTSRHGPTVLIAVDDASAMFVAARAQELAEASFLFPRPPDGLVRSLASKREMHAMCLAHDVPTPTSYFPACEQEVLECAAELALPIVAKRIDASQPGPEGSGETPSVLIVGSREDLMAAYRRMESPLGPNVMLQEYIPGSPETIVMFNGYFDASSECRLSFTGRKIRQSPPDTGATTLGECVENPTVAAQTRRLMKELGYRGILDIGFRFDERDGRYKLLDVNPRIGATFRLFVAQDGTDVLRAMYLDLTGQPIADGLPQPGRRWLVEPLDVRSSMTYIRRGDVTLREWARSYRGVRELAWIARDDMRPAAHVARRLLMGRLRRVAAE